MGTSDETNIRDRIEANECAAFLGVYSTLPSSALVTRFEQLKQQFEVQCLDREALENMLLSSPAGLDLAARFMPESFSAWHHENPRPANLFSDIQGLQCENCGKELLTATDKSGIVVTWRERRDGLPQLLYDVYWSCKGDCDVALKPSFDRPNAIDGWEDIPDMTIPQVYMKWVMSTINRLQSPDIELTDEAFEKMKTLLIELFPYVARELSSGERGWLTELQGIPMWMGGMG